MKLIIALIVIICGLAAYKIYTTKSKNAQAPKMQMAANAPSRGPSTLPVDIYIAREKTTNNLIYASGTIQANEELSLQSEVSGRLVQLNISEGQFIRKGDLIAKISDEDLVAQLKKNQFEAELAEQIEARQKKLLEINAISKEEYDLAVNKVNTLGADRELLEVQIEKTSIRAPFNGKIGFKNISVGAYINPNTQIASLLQTNPVKVDFSIPEKYSPMISKGQEIHFVADAFEQRFAGRVLAIDPKVDENLRTLKVRALTQNSNDHLKPGMFVRVEIPLAQNESIMIPTQAVVPILKGKKVFVLKNGQAEERIIQTGLRTDKEIEVDEGLAVGDSLIISSLMSVKPGMPLSIRAIVE